MSRAERWRARVIDRLWGTWIPRDRAEHELKGITLRFIGMTRDGTPDLNYAAQLSIGTTWDKWQQSTWARLQYEHQAIQQWIPDYDPQDGPLEPIQEGRIG